MNQQIWVEQLKKTVESWIKLSQFKIIWNKAVEERVQRLKKVLQGEKNGDIQQGCKNLGIFQFATQYQQKQQNNCKIHLADMKNLSEHYYFIKRLLLLGYHNIKTLHFLNCELHSNFFQDFIFIQCEIQKLIVQGGIFNDYVFNPVKQFYWLRLKQLSLSSVSFSNQGLKRFCSLEAIVFLKKIELNNTNITTDCIKVLRKKKSTHLAQIRITNQLNFNYEQFIRLLRFSRPNINLQIIMVGSFDIKDNYYMYMNHIWKIYKLVQFQIQVVFGRSNPQACLFRDTMTPDNAFKKLIKRCRKILVKD